MHGFAVYSTVAGVEGTSAASPAVAPCCVLPATVPPCPQPSPLPPKLYSSPQALLALRTHFADISRLCAECQSLIDCHDKIAVLSEVHRNLGKTLQVRARAWARPVGGQRGGHYTCLCLCSSRVRLGRLPSGWPVLCAHPALVSSGSLVSSGVFWQLVDWLYVPVVAGCGEHCGAAGGGGGGGGDAAQQCKPAAGTRGGGC